MEKDTKKRVTVEIGGNSLSLVTDEPEEFVKMIGKMLDNRMSALTKNNFRISTIDASLLCAVEAIGDKLKAERRIRSLEAQLDLYKVNLSNVQNELETLKSTLQNDDSAAEEAVASAETISAALRNNGESSPEDKIRALEKYLENKKSSDHRPDSAKSREEKIRYIESLLRGNDEEL